MNSSEQVSQVPAIEVCTASLVRDLYLTGLGDAPRDPSNPIAIRSDGSLRLVAEITNLASRPLLDTHVYLERLGSGNLAFTPNEWEVGVLGAGDIFYASWAVRVIALPLGFICASIVVASRGMRAVRLDGLNPPEAILNAEA